MTIRDVAQIAHDTIVRVMLIGVEKHGDSWRNRDDAEDIAHITAHVSRASSGDTSEPHLAHALTRLAMMLARRQESR